MIRIIVRTDDANALAHGAASNAEVEFKTFDVELPEVEAYLRLDKKLNAYVTRTVLGIELLDDSKSGIPVLDKEPK